MLISSTATLMTLQMKDGSLSIIIKYTVPPCSDCRALCHRLPQLSCFATLHTNVPRSLLSIEPLLVLVVDESRLGWLLLRILVVETARHVIIRDVKPVERGSHR